MNFKQQNSGFNEANMSVSTTLDLRKVYLAVLHPGVGPCKISARLVKDVL